MKPDTLSRKALNRALLARQMLLERAKVSTTGAVDRLVGLQAQQPQPPFIGLWTRVLGFERAALLAAIRGRQVVRATLLRATLHLVSAADYLWLRQTLQPMLSAGMQSVLRKRAEGLDIPAVVREARRFLAAQPRTFTDVRGALLKQFPGADERAMGYAVRTHLPLVAAPVDTEWGYQADPAFADAEIWLGKAPEPIERPEALVLRYLAAFGPAAAADVQTWSGLSGLREVLESLRPKLRTFRDERKRELFDLPDAPRPEEHTPAPVRFVPGFDNIILGHAERSRIIADEHRRFVTTKNLQVLPTFLVDGFVAGTWKSERVKSTASLILAPFAPLPRTAKAQLSEEGDALLRFIEPNVSKQTVRFEAR
jgi:hypothetical protein